MRRRWLIACLSVLGLLLVGGPVAAGDFTGTEKEERDDLPCPGPGEDVPANQSEPGPDDCPGEEDDETYRGYYWNNQVTCNDGEDADVVIGKLYTTTDTDDMSGGVGVCNDEDTGPLQGRIVAHGSLEDQSLTAYADGTEENDEVDTLQGWARADLSTDGPEVRCGADDGKRDATNPEDGDTMDNCGN